MKAESLPLPTSLTPLLLQAERGHIAQSVIKVLIAMLLTRNPLILQNQKEVLMVASLFLPQMWHTHTGSLSSYLYLCVAQIRTHFLHCKFAGSTTSPTPTLTCNYKGSCLGQLIFVPGLMIMWIREDPHIFLSNSIPSCL